MHIEYNYTYNKVILPVLPLRHYPDRWRGNTISKMALGLCEFFTSSGLEIAIPPRYDNMYDKWEYAYAARRRYPETEVLDINFMSEQDLFYLILAYGDDAFILYSSFFEYEESVIAKRLRLT